MDRPSRSVLPAGSGVINPVAAGLSRRALLGGAASAALAACGPPAHTAAAAHKLNFYNLIGNIGQSTLADFRAAAGIDVNMSLFTSDQELLARLAAGNPGFDVVAPSNDTVGRLISAGLLAPLDHARIPNFANIDLAFQDAPFDPGRAYSAPYTWQVLGVGYRRSKVLIEPNSWKWLFDSDRFAGAIGVIAQPDDLVRCCAKYLGKSANGLTDATLAQIEAMLLKQKANIKTFHQDNGQDLLLSGDVDIVLEYNGDIARVMRYDSDLAFVVPQEGSVMRSRCLCIPAKAPHPENAHAFINYLLDAKAGAETANTLLRPTANAAARALMDPKYQSSAVLFPPAEIMAKCEYAAYEGEAPEQAYADLVQRVRDYAPPPPAPPPPTPPKEEIPAPVVTIHSSAQGL